MTANHPFLDKYQTLINDRTLTLEEFNAQQKSLLRDTLAALKENQHADLA